MRFSLIAVVGLAAFSGKFGVVARPISTDLAPSSSTITVRDIEAPNLPRAPLDGVPEPAPEPVPEPETPQPEGPPEPVDPIDPEPDTDPAPVEPATLPEPGPKRPPPSPGSDEDPSSPDAKKPKPNTPPTGSEEEPIGLPNPPDDLKGVFSQAVDGLTPEIVPADKAMFYSGAGADHPTAESYYDGGELYVDKNDLVDIRVTSQLPDAITQKNEEDEYFDVISAAFGKAASGKVYVMLPKEGLQSETIFTKLEWPELTASGKVTEIIWVDPSKSDEPPSSMTTVIWKSDDGNAPFPLNKPISEMAH